MSNISKKIGIFGEQIACNYLKKNNYKIISQNTRVGLFEFDIIANFKEKIIFIEVKTRIAFNKPLAENSIDERKIDRLISGIYQYTEQLNIDPDNIRLDLISVDLYKFKNIAKIKHYKDIF